MPPTTDSRPILFVNSGIQVICFPLRADLRFTADQVGSGWQHCQCKGVDKVTQQEAVIHFGYLQWQILDRRLFLAVDTTIGTDEGEPAYFAKASNLAGDVGVTITGLLDRKGRPLPGLPSLEFIVRPATVEAGEERPVHMVVDFGNSRTGGLLVEFRGDTAQEPMMTPLRLVNRFHLDAWDEKGQWDTSNATWWFSSKSHWCGTPYLPAPVLHVTEYQEKRVKGVFGERVEHAPVTVRKTPQTFEEISQVRMGHEADELTGVINVQGEVRTGVSSPKRYLWARDASWLEGANWHMADPFDRYDARQHATTLKGPLLRFLSESDADAIPLPRYDDAPLAPRHAPRVLMVGALYEMLCQAFTFVNSPPYQRLTGDAGRMRVLDSLTLTFPSGMIAPERAQLQSQAEKAIAIFMQTVGRNQSRTMQLLPQLTAPLEPSELRTPELLPQLKLSIDEASSVHLTYLWSESRKLGGKPGLWFSVMGHTPPAVAPATDAPAAEPAKGKPQPGRPVRPTRVARVEMPSAPRPEVRIACIDIGGGTSDLMIASYQCKSDPGGDQIIGETLHRDGVSLAGDQLVKRLLERIIVPHFADVVALENNDAQLLFGKGVPANRHFRRQRIHWINRLFVPLAQAYLEAAVTESDAKITHTEPEIVAPDVVQSLQDTINSLWGAGRYNVKQDLNLWYGRTEFEQVVDEVFGDLIFDFCESIVEHRADVVLLAGLPTKLPYIRQLVETYLPLAKSRIVPMFNRYAGTWYPYQNPDNNNPGVIVDPKSTVVVGAAIEFCARHGMLPQFRFEMKDTAAKASFYWGVMTESRIDSERIVFDKQDEAASSIERKEITVTAQNLILGRKRRPRDDAQASPIYLLRVIRGQRLGEINFKVALERRRDALGEEELGVEEVEGTVDGESAVLGVNVLFEWRTLADERYYLDTGGLDKIELG
jgi:hypothetical protein